MDIHLIGINKYPALQLFQTPDKGLWGMPIFKDFFEEKKIKELDPEQRNLIPFKDISPDLTVEVFKKPYTSKTLSRLPLFAIEENDFDMNPLANTDSLGMSRDSDKLDGEKLRIIHSILAIYWAHTWSHCTPEVVLPQLYDTAYNHVPDGYDEWLEKIVDEKRHLAGVWVRPQDEVVIMYDLNFSEDAPTNLCVCVLQENILCGFHIDYSGYLNSNVAEASKTEGMEQVMKQRGVDLQTACFQEEIYNILVTQYYKEYYMLKPTVLKEGDREGPYLICTDIPMVAYVGFAKKS